MMTEQTIEQRNGIDLVRSIGGHNQSVNMASSYQRTREMTLDELMLENRVIFLIGEINQASAARVMMQMLYLEDQKRGQQINLYINSPGG
ncbi:MAG: ATP-dependent Clp protease proteolytic subunit, partial [Planctomycetota bacterium]|nr:ATP-dependent Clp protease proteolytic subunit [Planctomycetota bacterium]